MEYWCTEHDIHTPRHWTVSFHSIFNMLGKNSTVAPNYCMQMTLLCSKCHTFQSSWALRLQRVLLHDLHREACLRSSESRLLHTCFSWNTYEGTDLFSSRKSEYLIQVIQMLVCAGSLIDQRSHRRSSYSWVITHQLYITSSFIIEHFSPPGCTSVIFLFWNVSFFLFFLSFIYKHLLILHWFSVDLC